jgi:uncharacterized protein YecE (DUF72 family)
MVQGWHDKAPTGSIFAIKGSRFLTHIKRLKDTSRGLQKYFRRLIPLGDRTGPILWQLPPNFVKNDETFNRLDRFLGKLPRSYQHAVEFRHPSWMDETTFTLLRHHKAANVWLSSLRMPADYTVTADFVYLRFHGLQGGAYHDYAEDELEPWAKELDKAARNGLPAYVYFNNDLNTRAPLNAATLMSLLGAHAVGPKATESTPLPTIAPPVRGSETWPAWRSASGRRSASDARSKAVTSGSVHRQQPTATKAANRRRSQSHAQTLGPPARVSRRRR